jgi:hypothetical protein
MERGRPGIEQSAEGEGFEPPGTCIPRLFKSLAFGRSAIPPGAPSVAGPLPGGPPLVPVGDALDRGTLGRFEVSTRGVGDRKQRHLRHRFGDPE